MTPITSTLNSAMKFETNFAKQSYSRQIFCCIFDVFIAAYISQDMLSFLTKKVKAQIYIAGLKASTSKDTAILPRSVGYQRRSSPLLICHPVSVRYRAELAQAS